MQYPIYLDYNATTPCDPKVVEKMLPYFNEHFGNATSKSHAYGWYAEEAVESAREEIAKLLHAHANEIIFTSGATESCNLAIKGYAEKNKNKGNHIITALTEHKAVLDACEHLANHGYEITYLRVDSDGQISLDELEKSITSKTIMIALMHANNETGVIHPVNSIGSIASRHNICFFCDATQTFGKTHIDLQNDKIDMLAFSGHKIYGPKGIGGLYIRNKDPRLDLNAMLHGGGHERALRSGTLNVPGIVGLGAAAHLANINLAEDMIKYKLLNEQLTQGIQSLSSVNINGLRANRMMNVLNFAFNIEGGENLLKKISKHIAVSSGSACASSIVEPSHVLTAMGYDRKRALSSIRFSFGRPTTQSDIDLVVEHVHRVLNH